jgi:hypothetical protein
MNIVIGEENIAEVKDRMTVLELDSFKVYGQTIKSYCILGEVNLQDLLQLESLTALHANLIKNYRLKNWNYCEQAIEHLLGRWNGEVDTFYETFLSRIKDLKTQSLDDSWDGSVQHT